MARPGIDPGQKKTRNFVTLAADRNKKDLVSLFTFGWRVKVSENDTILGSFNDFKRISIRDPYKTAKFDEVIFISCKNEFNLALIFANITKS